MTKQYFNQQIIVSLIFILFGIICSHIFVDSLPISIKSKNDRDLILELIKIGPFTLGLLLASRILSNDERPKGNFWWGDHLFFILASFLMAISMLGLGIFISSHGWFVLEDRKNSHDVTGGVLSLGGLISCFILYKISPRLFGSIESIFLPMISFLALTYILTDVRLPVTVIQLNIVHILVVVTTFANLIDVSKSNRYIFYFALVLAYSYYYIFLESSFSLLSGIFFIIRV